MQTKILDFEIDNEAEAQLFGDFGSLKPYSIDGVAHALPKDSGVVLTFYSDTGIETPEGRVCSADLRLYLTNEALNRIASQLAELASYEKPEPTNNPANERPEDAAEQIEKLSPPL